MGWVDLSTLYVKKSGDTMEGSLTIPQNQTLTCYNDTTAYNVGATLKSLQDSVSHFGHINPAAHTGFYISCYETVAGVSVGYNVNPPQTLAKNATVATITTEKAFANTGTLLLRGTHAANQCGMFVTFGADGHTITLTTEAIDIFELGDTGNFLVPCVWA